MGEAIFLGDNMAYATIEELKSRTDQNILRQLSDDNDLGIAVNDILQDALDSGSDYADNMVPSYLNTASFLKEIALVKAQEILFRRKGYIDGAKSNMEMIESMINQGAEKHQESAYPNLNSTPQAHTTTPVDEGKWDNWFEDDVW